MATGGNSTEENVQLDNDDEVASSSAGKTEATNIDTRTISSEQHLQSLQRFHQRCGHRITLSNANRTAMRALRDFSHGLVFSAEPLVDDVMFEVVIERKNHSWGGSIEIGVTAECPDTIDIPSCATVLRNGTWVMSGIDVRKDSVCIVDYYGTDLEALNEGDRVGVMRTSEGDLVFYINGQSQGIAARNIPKPVWALVDLYGRCVKVSICPTDACPSSEYEEPVMDIPRQIHTVLANLSTLASSSSTSSTSSNGCLGTAAASNIAVLLSSGASVNPLGSGSCSSVSTSSSSTNASTVPLALADYCDMNGHLRFHTRCGSLVKLSPNCRSAERRRPLDEFNNGVVMTHRPLKDNELFEIRIDKLVNKWSGSIEVGVTTHNPSILLFPATMTNMRSGTIMMSGCGILTNGKGTRGRFGELNLDELREGDRVGMMRKSNNNLHYFLNGQDQGVAAARVAPTLWGVIDLYGMTIKVTIVDRDERESQNLVTRRNTMTPAALMNGPAHTAGVFSLPLLNLPSPDGDLTGSLQSTSAAPLLSAVSTDDLTGDDNAEENDVNNRNGDRLTFHPICGTYAMVSRNGRKAYRPNAADDFNNGVVLTRRHLRPNELFQVRLDRVITKWAGSVEMGVTTFSAEELDFPFTMTNVRSGTWMMTGNGVMHNGITVIEQYGQNLDRLQVGDRVGVVRKDDGTLHFWVNGIDQGPAAHNVPDKIYGVIDLYGQAAQATIVDSSECGTPDTGGNSTISNTTLYSEPPLRFHTTIHGKNAGIINGGLTAVRPNSLAEFNDAIVFSSRPLRQRELFEVQLETVACHWSGNIEIGVVSMRPEELQLAANATDLKAPDTIILCGNMIFHNRKALRANVDVDLLSVRARVGVMRIGDSIHFSIDGVDHGPSVECRAANVWAVVDLYGQCAQVSLTQQQPDMRAPYATSENSQSCQATSVIQPTSLEAKHRWTCISGNVQLTQNWTVATRGSGNQAALSHGTVFSEPPLAVGAPFEIKIIAHNSMFSGSLSIGVTDLNLADSYVRKNIPIGIKRIPANVWYLTGNTVCHNSGVLQSSMVSLDWLREGDRIALELTAERTLRLLINSEDMQVHFQNIPSEVYVVVELEGATMAVQVMSTQAPSSPLRPCSLRLQELQDSLDFGGDSLNKQDSMLESIETEHFEFGDNLHGKHISLMENHKVAMRTLSYNQGLVFVTKPLCRGETISIKIESINVAWNGTIGLGVIGHCPQMFLGNNAVPIPSSIMQCRRPCWVVTDDFININGQRFESNYGEALKHIECGTIITMSLSHNGLLSIIVIGESTNNLEELGTNLPNNVYPVFDVYGKCEKISILSPNEAAQQSGTPIIEDVPIEMDKSSLNVALTLDNFLKEIVDDVVTVAERRAETNDVLEKVELPATCETTPQKAESEKAEEDALVLQEQFVRIPTGNTPTPNSSTVAGALPHTPTMSASYQHLNENDARWRAEKATFDLPEKDVNEVAGGRNATNSMLEINRSLMESLEENLLKNLTIRRRTSEQHHAGDGLGASTSSVCCLQESLQLQHNTNLSIQRSQSTQRFTNSFNALVSAASGISMCSPTTTTSSSNNFNNQNNNNNENNNSALLNTNVTTTITNATSTSAILHMNDTESHLQASTSITSTITSPIPTTTQSGILNCFPSIPTSISPAIFEWNPARALLRSPTVPTEVAMRTFFDSNREEYEREQQNVSTFRSVISYHEHSLQMLNRDFMQSDDHIDMLGDIVNDDDDDDNDENDYEMEIEHVDDDQEKNWRGHARETDDDDNDDEDDDEEDTGESELSINLGNERDPSHHTNDDNGSANDNESHDYEYEDPVNADEMHNRQSQQENQTQSNSGAPNDEIDDDDDLDVETSLESNANFMSLVAHARRLNTADDDMSEELNIERFLTLARYQRCGHFYKCSCSALQNAPSNDHIEATENPIEVDLASIWQERCQTPTLNVEVTEKHALDEIESESKQIAAISQLQKIDTNSEDDDSSIDRDKSLSNFGRFLGACAPEGPAYDLAEAVLVDETNFADVAKLSLLPAEEWTTEEEEEVQPDIVEYSIKWPGVKLPLNVTVSRYNAFLKRLSSPGALKCDYQQLMINFVQTLVLPRIYMDTQMPVVCFCENCYGRDATRLHGWAYFKLNTSVANKRAETSVAQLESCNGEWLPLYYMTGVDNVRRILDLGHLLPHDVYKRKEHRSSEADMGSKEEPSRRVELHVSPNAKTLQMCTNKPKILVFEDKKYRLYTAFEVYVRRQALRHVRQASTDLDDSQQSDMHSSTLAVDFERNFDTLFLHYNVRHARIQQLGVDLTAETAASGRRKLARDTEKTTTNDGHLSMESDDDEDVSAQLSDTESACSSASASQTSNTRDGERVLNAAAIAMAAVQGPRLKERIWFTKEAGACIMTALMFKLELKSSPELHKHNFKLFATSNVKEVKKSASGRLIAKKVRAARILHFQKSPYRNRRSGRSIMLIFQPTDSQKFSSPRQRLHRTRMHNIGTKVKPEIPTAE